MRVGGQRHNGVAGTRCTRRLAAVWQPAFCIIASSRMPQCCVLQRVKQAMQQEGSKVPPAAHARRRRRRPPPALLLPNIPRAARPRVLTRAHDLPAEALHRVILRLVVAHHNQHLRGTGGPGGVPAAFASNANQLGRASRGNEPAEPESARVSSPRRTAHLVGVAGLHADPLGAVGRRAQGRGGHGGLGGERNLHGACCCCRGKLKEALAALPAWVSHGSVTGRHSMPTSLEALFIASSAPEALLHRVCADARQALPGWFGRGL